MNRAYFWVATILAIYCWMITAAWLVAPAVPLTSWGLDFEPVSASFGLRLSMGTAGFGVALFLVRREPPSRGRLAVTVAFTVSWIGYAAVGVYSVVTGAAGAGMLATVAVELVVAAVLAWAEFSTRARARARVESPTGAVG